MAPTSLSETVEDLMDSLDTLEDVLAPVLDAGPLSSTLEKLDVLERAKLQATLTYVTQDLVFMYLKSKGIDPAKHPVLQQMSEVGKYFNKIKEAENPAKRKLAVDKDAAKRFITAAISGRTFPPNASTSQDGPSSGSAPTGLEAHLKKTQKQIDRERLLEEDSSSEEEDLAIIEEPEQASPPTATTSTSTAKRSRAAMDPFAGYEAPADASPQPKKKSKKKRDGKK